MSSNTPVLTLVSDNGDVPKERTETTYATREQAQAWLLKLHASLVHGGNLGTPVRWTSIMSRIGPWKVDSESSIWPLQHVLLDGDGVITFVHRKRVSYWLGLRDVGWDLMCCITDPFLSVWSPEMIQQHFERIAREQKRTNEQTAEKLLGLALSTSMNAFWKQVANNLQQRRIRLIFADQEIPNNVRDPIELLNKQLADIEMLAVEVGNS